MVAEFAEQQSLDNLILTHFSPRHQDKTGQQAITEEVRQFYKGHFYLANDFDEFTLNEAGQLLKVDKTIKPISSIYLKRYLNILLDIFLDIKTSRKLIRLRK